MNFMEILNTLALFCMLFATGTHSFLECREPTFLYNNQCVTAKEACPDVRKTFSTASKTCVQCPPGYSNPDYFTDRCLTPLNRSIVEEKVPEVSPKPTPATPINSPTPLIPTSTLQPERKKPGEDVSPTKATSHASDKVVVDNATADPNSEVKAHDNETFSNVTDTMVAKNSSDEVTWPTKPGGFPGWAVTVIIVVVLVAMICIIVVVVFIFRKSIQAFLNNLWMNLLRASGDSDTMDDGAAHSTSSMSDLNSVAQESDPLNGGSDP